MPAKEWDQQKIKDTWQTACAQLQLELSQGVYNTWILPNRLISIENQGSHLKLTFSSPSGFHSRNLKQKMDVHLRRVLGGILEKDLRFEFQVGSPVATSQPQTPSRSPQQASSEQSFQEPTSQTPLQPQNSAQSQQPNPLQNSQNNSLSPRAEDLFSPANVAVNSQQQVQSRARSIGLSPDYTFETFAVSSSNEMAHAAATAVSQNPGQAYNPLFLYGGVGVGKTHLMHAIGYNILLSQPTAKIIYSTGEEFTNQIVDAIQTKKTIGFKSRYRNIDVLLLDDVQFIAGKKAVQEEFFHTFNALIKNKKQIVLTSDRPPHEILMLESRLRSRLEAGLMIDIGQPSFELRTAILLIKAKALNIQLTIEMAKLIASRVDSARKIGGILNSLRSSIELKGQELNDELIERTLSTEADQKRPQLNAKIQDVIKTVANHYRLKQQIIKGKSRKKKIIQARHVAMYICKEYLHESYAEIGKWFSGRDHSTVLHAYHKISEQLPEDDQLMQQVSALRMSLSGMR